MLPSSLSSLGEERHSFRPPWRTTWVEIDHAAYANNIREMIRHVGPSCKVAAVVKGNAYGHGMIPMSHTALNAGASMLCVATLLEVGSLRKADIVCPVLVMGHTAPLYAPDAVHWNATTTVLDMEYARALSCAAVAHKKVARVHLKIDTGMGRLGIRPQDACAFVQELVKLPNLEWEGCFTHFSCADSTDLSFTLLQLERFNDVLNQLSSLGLRPPLVHAANSAAALSVPQSRFDMVRCGIALYGLHPSPAVPCPRSFLPVLAWKARITQVKRVPPGTPCSYGNTWTATDWRTLATLAVGYADGFPRAPVTWQSVLIRGQQAPIVGRICMDQTIVDITDVSYEEGRPIQTGEEVVLIGRQGTTIVSTEDIAQRIQSINYEVVCRILPRVSRVHLSSSYGDDPYIESILL